MTESIGLSIYDDFDNFSCSKEINLCSLLQNIYILKLSIGFVKIKRENVLDVGEAIINTLDLEFIIVIMFIANICGVLIKGW